MNTRRKFLIIILLIAAAIGIYINRSYAHFFNYMNRYTTKDPNTENLYTVGDDSGWRVGKTIKYAGLGDSLTAGSGTESYTESFPYQLAQKISADGNKIKFLNLGQPGGKASDIIAHQLQKAIDFQPDFATILIGTNDLFEQVEKTDYARQLEEIIVELKSKTKARIIVASVPQIGIYPAMLWPQTEYFDLDTQKLNTIIKNIATANSIEFIDLYSYSKNLDKTGDNFYSPDSFHPNKNGYRAWAEFFYANYRQ